MTRTAGWPLRSRAIRRHRESPRSRTQSIGLTVGRGSQRRPAARPGKPRECPRADSPSPAASTDNFNNSTRFRCCVKVPNEPHGQRGDGGDGRPNPGEPGRLDWSVLDIRIPCRSFRWRSALRRCRAAGSSGPGRGSDAARFESQRVSGRQLAEIDFAAQHVGQDVRRWSRHRTGACPVSISHSTTPKDQMSARLSTVFPRGLLRTHVRGRAQNHSGIRCAPCSASASWRTAIVAARSRTPSPIRSRAPSLCRPA